MLYPFCRNVSDLTIPPRVWLVIGSLPMVVDVGVDFAGIFKNTFLSRTATGLFVGIVAAFFLLPVWIGIAYPRLPESQEHSFKEHSSA